jgi:subtilisin family serine protease
MAAPSYADSKQNKINASSPSILKTDKTREAFLPKYANLKSALADKKGNTKEATGKANVSPKLSESSVNTSGKKRKSAWKTTETTKKTKSSQQAQPNFKVNKDKPAYNPDELIIKFKPNASTKQTESIFSKHQFKTVKKFSLTKAKLVKTPKGQNINKIIEELKKDSSVEYVQPNYRYYRTSIPNDPSFGQLWGLHNTGQSILGFPGQNDVDIDAPEAWDITQGSDTVVVGVIDTGIDINHPDLQSKIWRNAGEIAGDGIDNDQNGYIDDVNGWDFWNGDKSVFDDPIDDMHATHVAGTIAAASNNNAGVAGIAPNIKIMPLKFIGPE